MPLLSPPKRFTTESPLLPIATITTGLDAIETPLVQAQVATVSAAADRLMLRALPLVERRDIAGVEALEWQAAIALQMPIYDLWVQAYALGGEHMQQAFRLAIPRNERSRFSGIPEFRNRQHYVLSVDVARLLSQFFDLEPGQLIASAAQQAVLNRVIQLAGSFARSQLRSLKDDLIAAIVPQPDTGNPISREDLLQRIQSTLNVGRVRADNIARTEITHAYNRGRVSMGLRSELLDGFRFLAIDDSRTTDICRTRNGMIILRSDSAGLAANTPAMHFRCRSTLSPILSRVNARHRTMLADPDRRRQARELAPLLPGWVQ